MNIIDTALSIIAPHICLGCGAEGAVICQSCVLFYPTLPSICYICARGTTGYAPCASHQSKYGPRRVYIAGEYSGVLQDAIRNYKFEFKRSGAKDIAFFLDNAVPYIEEYVVSYVPTTGIHIRERGFDHTKNISKAFARMRSLPHAETMVRVSSVTQKGANKHIRKKQLIGAFRALPQRVSGKKILLIDDVITTGATIEECAKQLYKAGACMVDVIAVARTP